MAVTVTPRTPATIGRATRIPITQTTAQTVLSVTPSLTGTYLVGVYLVVENATTTVTVQVQWTDPDTGAQETATPVNGASLGVGVYPQAPLPVVAQGGTALTVTVTASAANNVIATATITDVR